MTLLAGLQALLWRYTGQDDISGGDADREPEPGGDGRADRVLREHAGAADGGAREPSVSWSCWGG